VRSDRELDRQALAVMEQVMDLAREERKQRLEELCGGNDTLRARVEDLLGHDTGDTFAFDDPWDSASARPEPATIPDAVGPYRLIKRLGEGGMGTVYLAQRADGVYERQVAIKFVRNYNPAANQQFAFERQLLAKLKHPNIAQLIDGGEVDGQPYLVMEYVDGVAISKFSQQADVSLGDVIRLFIQVALSVHHAHGQLVIHRDIKPGNVLVTGDKQVKLLDFGIAKLYQADDGPATDSALTQAGLTPITPDYASPEQLAGERVTPASDVYALGVLMYETLTGERPFRFSGLSLPEANKLRRESITLSPSGAAQSLSGGRREQKFTQVQLRGDLDRIVLKAMHLDPERRYASAAHLADDLQAFLDGKPVSAHGDDWLYKTRKFVSRYRVGVAAAGVALVALIVGLLVTSNLYLRAEAARSQADLRFNQLRELARSMMFSVYDEIDKVPGTASARKMLVADVQTYLETLANTEHAPAEVKLDAARGYSRLYEIFNRQAVTDKTERTLAEDALARAQTLLQNLVAESPGNVDAYVLLGDLFSQQADETLYTQNDPVVARGQITQAQEAYDQAAAYQAISDLTVKNTDGENQSGENQTPNDRASDGPMSGRGELTLKRLRAERLLADTYKWEVDLEQAIAILDGLIERIEGLRVERIEGLRVERPNDPALLKELAESLALRGESHFWTKDADQFREGVSFDWAQQSLLATEDYTAAIHGYETLLAQSDDQRAIKDKLMIAYWSLGNLRYELEQWPAALSNYDGAVALLEPQVKSDPNDSNTVRKLHIINATRSKALSQVGLVEEALALNAAGNLWFEQRAAKDPDTPVALREVALSYDTTADILATAGRTVDACEWRRKTLTVWQTIAEKWGVSEFDQQEPVRIQGLLDQCPAGGSTNR